MESFCDRQRILEKAIRGDSLQELLDVIGRFPELGLTNALILWEMKKDARIVCGKRAFERAGYKVRDDAEKTDLMLPVLTREGEGYSIQIRRAACFDISDTYGDGVSLREEIDIEKALQLREGIVIALNSAGLKGRLYGAYEDEGEEYFYVSSALRKDKVKYELSLISMYVDSIFFEDSADELTRGLTKYCAFIAFFKDKDIYINIYMSL